jgi:hypothetical protein
MTKQFMTLNVRQILPADGKAPGIIKGVDVDDGQDREVKCYEEKIDDFRVGSIARFEWYLGKEWDGRRDMIVSKFGDIEIVPTDSQAPLHPVRPDVDPLIVDALPEAFTEKPLPRPQNTPVAVVAASRNTTERSIQILAIMKSVIEAGGSPDGDDVERWLARHDALLAGG